MNDEIKNLMSQRKTHYDLWKSNRKNESCDSHYVSYHKLDNQVKYAIRASKKECFVTGYNETVTSKERWNLIHKFGVTSKARKNAARDMEFSEEFSLDKLNEHFTKLKPLPYHDLNLNRVTSKFNFEPVSPIDVQIISSKITSNATGPDGIPPKCFKLLRDYIIEPISIIIN